MENARRYTVQMIIFGLVTIFFISILITASNATESKRTASFSYRSYDRLVEKTYDVIPGGTLTLTSSRGSIDIEGWDRDEVRIKIEMSGTERYIEDVDISFDHSPDGVTVKVDVPSERIRFWGIDRVRLNFQLMVPEIYNTEIRTAGGSITAKNLEGQLRGRTSGGSIRLEELNGDISFTTSGGSIRTKKLGGKVTLRTSGGGIYIEDAQGPVDVRTSGGRIELKEISGRVNAQTSGGSVYLSYLGENEGISLRTSGGGIRVELPSQVNGYLNARTSGGSVSSEIPVEVVGKIDRRSIEGKINKGGPEIDLRTSGGSIRIMSR